MRSFIATAALCSALISAAMQFPDAPTGFDNKTNGMVDDATHQADQVKFEEVEQLSDGLGPAALTSPMALRLIAAFKYSDGRLAVLKLLAPRMVDRPTRYQIEQLFPLIGDQERVRKILGMAG